MMSPVAAQLALVTVAVVMAGIVACPSCGKNSRPAAASGSPVCAACRTAPVLAGRGDTRRPRRRVLDANVPVVVDLWALRQGPCRMVALILDSSRSSGPGSSGSSRSTSTSFLVFARYGVQGIPTLFFSAMATRSLRQVGAAPRHALERWLDPMSVSSMIVVDRGGPLALAWAASGGLAVC